MIDKIVAGIERDENLLLLDDLCQTMVDGSLCAMGGLTPMPVQSAIKYFPEDFDRPPTLRRHSGESRNPIDVKKIPASAGMTEFGNIKVTP